MPSRLLMGNEAFAWAALEAGVNVVAGYPGTPSSELVETVAKLHAQGIARGVHVEWSTNEKSALEMLAGASLCGARTLFTCKQMGLNVAADALMSLNYVGIKGGFVLFVSDDPGPISSQTEQDTRRFANFAKVPVLDPSSPDEGYKMMKAAFDISEKYGTPVIVRPTTRVNHASTFFDVPEETVARPIPEEGFVKDPKWVIFPKRSYAAHAEINKRLAEMTSEFSEGSFNPVIRYKGTEASAAAAEASAVASVSASNSDAGASTTCDASSGARLGIVCGGVSGAYALDAIDMLVAKAKFSGKRDQATPATATSAELPAFDFIQVGTPFPFPEEKAATFAEGKTDILVFEELDYVLEDEFAKMAGRRHLPYNVHGKCDGTTLTRGENSVEDCLVRIAKFLGCEDLVASPAAAQDKMQGQTGIEATATGAAADADNTPDTMTPPMRPPVLCAGCPHRGAFYAVKRALRGRKNVMCGDIGCYTLGNAKPLEAVDTCLCMGAGITMAQGFSVADPDAKCLAFVGDSTFFASGMTGVANAVYNQHDITIVVLDNSTTAMTGGQPHPGIGTTLMGGQSEPIKIDAVLEALGVKLIVSANPLYLQKSIDAAREAIDFEGPSAIIFRSPCTQLVKPEPAAIVDSEACIACRACINSIGCPAMSMSIQTGKMTIDPATCYGCGLCVDVCPKDAISAVVRTEGRIPFSSTEKGGN